MQDLSKQGLAVFGIMTILFNGGNVAQGQSLTDRNHRGDSSLAQVNNVFELRDVSPDDWAFEALRNLIERYGCIAGSPDGRFYGDRALTRYEFAAALNQCLRQIEDLISNNPTEVMEGDLATLQRLTRDFEAELTNGQSRRLPFRKA
jgi:hypothetical protein